MFQAFDADVTVTVWWAVASETDAEGTWRWLDVVAARNARPKHEILERNPWGDGTYP